MSSAAAREARRKAILSRGTDRLAKLTTSSGRSEDVVVNSTPELAPDPPLPSFPASTETPSMANLRNFVGEEAAGMPQPRLRQRVPPRTNTNASNASPADQPDPSAWAADQQAQFLQALMGGAPPPGIDGAQANPFTAGNPLAALMGMGGGAGAGMDANGGGPDVAGKARDVLPPKTRLQCLLPALHFAAAWALLLYFMVVREPAAHAHDATNVEGLGFAWRWRHLAGPAKGQLGEFATAWGVQMMPFFWAFVTLQLVLHSISIYSGFDAFRPPTLLALALPHLPPPIPSVIVHSIKYFQMGSMFLDDVAAVVVGIGLVVWLATWRET
ncbi:hypothetical protein GGX14DRAFT_427193 [Mycena pura]|uniref:Uncharacterized protein n=1 Tax=Mycena pura TaxID=153505 RepID=A0AAD6YLW2_9AGAR|nr:hypothetical protein GGX14DRAFT_427193 [Mycena pura]